MKPLLLKLSRWLQQNQFQKEAQEVQDLDEYQEPWHEEAVQEFGANPISEEDYQKQLQEEAEEYLEKEDLTSIQNTDKYKHVAEHNLETFMEIFRQEGFKPLSGAGQELVAGEGEYGVVFRGVYQGRPAVAKVILEDGITEDEKGNPVPPKADEIRKWEIILNKVEQISPPLRKHLPRIYHLAQDQIPDSYNDTIEYGIIIMEELYPLPRPMKQLMQGVQYEDQYLDYSLNPVDPLLKDEEYLYQIAQNVVAALRIPFSLKDILGDITPDDVLKVLLGAGKIDTYSSQRLTDLLIQMILKKHPELKGNMKPREWTQSDIRYQLRNTIYAGLNNALRPADYKWPRVQTQAPTSGPFFQSSPETKSLLAFLQELAEAGVAWRDVHMNNLMVNRDGEIKIVDVGLYRTENQKQEPSLSEAKTESYSESYSNLSS